MGDTCCQLDKHVLQAIEFLHLHATEAALQARFFTDRYRSARPQHPPIPRPASSSPCTRSTSLVSLSQCWHAACTPMSCSMLVSFLVLF